MLDGRCAGRTLYFSACLTLDISDDMLTAFVGRTGAKAIVGYEKPIEWLESAAFECLLLERARPRESDRRVLQRLAARPW